jgi:hypothetical protein
MTGKVPVCDVCGAPATRATRDLKQVQSRSPWAEWEPVGEWRTGCDDHPPEDGKLFSLDGQDITKRYEALIRSSEAWLGIPPEESSISKFREAVKHED